MNRNGNLLGKVQAAKLRTLALGYIIVTSLGKVVNDIRCKYFVKPNECMVAFFYEGNPAIYKNDAPHIRMYFCYENERGKRRVIEQGSLSSKRRGLKVALHDWKNYKVCFPSIPRYDSVINGEEIQGAKWLAYLSDLFATKRMR